MRDFFDVWHQPLLGALHVLGIAWFGATLWTNEPRLRRIGLAWMVLTGLALFALNPDRLGASTAFRLKLALLTTLVFVRGPRWLVLTLWAAVVFAARGVAYF
jgi:hypothetical protein